MVGTVGRTDLCGPERTEPLARQMFHSLRRSDELARRPAPSTRPTAPGRSAPPRCRRAHDHHRPRAGHEPTVRVADEDEFVARLLAGFGTFPTYFPRLPELNRLGPRRYDALPRLDRLSADDVDAHLAAGGAVVDARPVAAFAAGHIPGSMAEHVAAAVRQLARLARRPGPAARVRPRRRPGPRRAGPPMPRHRLRATRRRADRRHRRLASQRTPPRRHRHGRARRHARAESSTSARPTSTPPATSPAPATSSSAPSPDHSAPRRAVDRDVRPRRAGHDRRQPPHRPRPRQRQRARRRPRHLGGATGRRLDTGR